MKTWRRICIHTYTVTDQDGVSFTLEQGREYLTSGVLDDNRVMVFSSYWVSVPLWVFAGEEPAYG